MKTWIKIAMVMVSLQALCACESANSIDGSLYVAKTFSFTDKNGKAQTLEGPKSYSATLNLNAQQTELSISTGLFQNVSIVAPNAFQDKVGSFSISAAVLNQSFSINGNIDNSSANVDNSHNESCVYSYSTQYICTQQSSIKIAAVSAAISADKKDNDDKGGKDKDDNKGNKGNDRDDHTPQTVCSYQQIPNYGHAWVSETLNVTDKNASLTLTDASQVELANFSGSYQVGSQVVSYSEGPCGI
jgi:hypothetical protein